MRLIKLLLGLLVLALLGGVLAAVAKTKRGEKKPAPTLSYDTWPTVPRKPAPTSAA